MIDGDVLFAAGDADENTVSVVRVDDTRAICQTGACIYLLDDATLNTPTYASTLAGGCDASNVISLVATIIGTRQAPTPLML